MKTILLTFLTMATFQSVLADTKIDDKTCQDLATDASLSAFSNLKNSNLFQVYGYKNQTESANYATAIQNNLHQDYKKFCDSKKDNVTIEEFMEKHRNTCESQCDKDSKLFKEYLIGENTFKIRVVNICKDQCKTSFQKLEFLKLGTILAKDNTDKSSPDCSGAVSNKGRGLDIKAIEFNANTGTSTIKTTEK